MPSEPKVSKESSNDQKSKPEKESFFKKLSKIPMAYYNLNKYAFNLLLKVPMAYYHNFTSGLKNIVPGRENDNESLNTQAHNQSFQREPLSKNPHTSERHQDTSRSHSNILLFQDSSTIPKKSNDLMQDLSDLKEGKFKMTEFDDTSGQFKTTTKTLDNLSNVKGTIVLRGEAAQLFLEATKDTRDPAMRYKIAKEISETHTKDTFTVGKDNGKSLDKFMTEAISESLDKQIKQYQEKLATKTYDSTKAMHRAEKANLFSQLAQGVKDSKSIKELSGYAEATFTTRDVLKKEQLERLDKEQPSKARPMEKQNVRETNSPQMNHQKSSGGIREMGR